MSISSSSVHILPPEVWGEISAYLEVPNIQKLLQTGNRRFTQRLQRGVQSISCHTVGCWNDADAWPKKLWSVFPRVKEARISRSQSTTYGGRGTGTLSSSQLFSLPQLSKLDLADYFIATMEARAITRTILNSLPSTCLVWLSLPAFQVQDEHCALLPPLLKYLELARSSIGSEGLKVLPGDLEHLILRDEISMTDEDFRSMPAQLLKIEVHIAKHIGLTYVPNVLLSLPSQISSLILDVDMSLPVRTLPHLPSTLEVLRLSRARVIDDEKLVRFSLPPGIMDLAIGHIEGRQLLQEAMEALPPLLRAFSLKDASNFLPSMVILIPRTVKRCDLRKARRLTPQSLDALPPGLTHFTIGGASLSMKFIERLPLSIIHLDTRNIDIGGQVTPWPEFLAANPLQNLESWTTKQYYFSTFDQPHPFYHLNLYEKPTLLRTIGYAIARTEKRDVAQLLARAISAYFLFRHSSWIVPSIPTLLSNVFLRYKNSLLGIGLTALYAFR
jgi:hypothetical protein